MAVNLEIVSVDRHAPFPQRGTAESAGLDCFSTRPVFLRPGETQVIGLGFKIALPPGTWGLLKERSSMGCRGVFVLGGVIDADYRGELMALLHNVGKDIWIVEEHQICQLIVMPLQRVNIQETASLTVTV